MMRYEKSSFKSIFKVKPFEWCSIILGRNKPNAIVRTFIDSIRSKLPDTMVRCPLHGQIAAFNVPIKNKMMKIFPAGIYKVSAHGYSESDSNIFYFSLIIKLEN